MNKTRSFFRLVAFLSTCAFLAGCGGSDAPQQTGSGEATTASAAPQTTTPPAQNTPLAPPGAGVAFARVRKKPSIPTSGLTGSAQKESPMVTGKSK
jgi:hypothetical protein